MHKNIAFFDFDGTITTKDTMLEFTKYSQGLFRYYLGLFLISPWLIAMKIHIISKKKGKEKFISYFFKNILVKKFDNDCLSFTKNIIPLLIKKNALLEIIKHKENKSEIVVVSASAENWVAPWCVLNNLNYICTKLKIENNKIMGTILGQNCNGAEKVNRINEKFDTANYKNIYCYGDSSGDKEMLGLANFQYYRTL